VGVQEGDNIECKGKKVQGYKGGKIFYTSEYVRL